MINKNELIFAVDENNNPIEPVERQKAHADGIWHRTTNIVVINSKDDILCHKRSILKDTGPGLWDSCFGGHLLAGEDSLINAQEELNEEVGLDVNPKDLEFLGIVKHTGENEKNREFRYFYIYNWDGSAKDIKFERDEIDEVKWFPLEILKNNRENTKVWSPMPYLDMLLNKIYERSRS